MNYSSSAEKADHIARCIEFAVLLEVSGYPKPGNVHRTADFPETRYEHFLASAVATAPSFRKAARQGIKVAGEKIAPSEVGIGNIIKDAVDRMRRSQSGGNTLLGAIILLAPIAAAAGMIRNSFSLPKLRENIKVIVESTTPEDAVAVYDAIALLNPGGLNRVKKLDVTDPESKKILLGEDVTLFDTFEIASSYDSVASEWVHNYSITFDLGYPYFVKQLEETGDINTATVHAFLKILAEVPDTFISRKVGQAKAEIISAEAGQVLKEGGLTTPLGRNLLQKLDSKLRDSAHKLSPGTTADITEAVLALNNLNGYKP
ncbi:MAG TPA: ATP--dephospho-CoA triphosphoribosyl transferase CitG [Candidatus Bathyarchaeota archaeon]|nr:ATP--dephospho-CoA triphosphoribosyl transferase CitG [Candidatus Bathyarchaeota archaeon]